MRVTRDQRAPRADEIDVFVAVGVTHTGTLARDDEGRLAADGAEGAHRTRHAAGHELFGAIVQLRVRRGEGHRSASQAAASRAKYVTMTSATARAMPVSDSSAARRRSSHPRSAAAWSAAYSPLT